MWSKYLHQIVFSRLLFFFLSFPLLVAGSVLCATTFKNDLSAWLPPDSAARKSFAEYTGAFGSNEVVLITWPTCTVDNSILPDIESTLQAAESGKYFNYVTSGYSIDRQLGDPLKLSDKARLNRLSGYWINPQTGLTFIVAKLSEFGIGNRDEAFSTIYQTLESEGIAREEIRLAGPSVDLRGLGDEGFWSPFRVVPYTGGIVFLISWSFLRDLRIAFFVNLLSIYAGAFSLALIYLAGVPLNLIVWTLPTLVALLTTSTSLHFLSYYRDSLLFLKNELEAPKLAFSNALNATTLCAITTAVGLFSLTTSGVSPVFQFGIFGGISVLFSCFAVLFWLPEWLRIFPYRRCLDVGEKDREASSDRWMEWALTCSRFRKPILICFVIVLLLLAIQLPSLKTGVSNKDLFLESSLLIQDQKWMQANLCEINSTEVRLEFSNSDESNDGYRMRWLLYLQTRLKGWDEFTGANSAGTYSPKPTKRRRLIDRFKDQAIEIKLLEQKNEFVLAGLISPRTTAGSESWLLSLRGPSLDHAETQALVSKLHDFLTSEFARVQEKHFANEELNLSSSGFSIVNNELEQRFLQDLILTYATAFSLMSLLFALIFRSWKLLAISMLPNLFPAVAVLGGLAALGVSLDVGSLMTASVALGIAVDDTLHFLLWWRSKSATGLSSKEAICDALRYCGVAMLQTTVVFGIGLSLYAFSGFLPTIRFGLLLSGMLLFAIVGDLVLIPALLSTRLGRRKMS
jgi:predicted RND superfamily exporter protein